MTHKEENIVNITVKAMELLNAGKIRQDEEQGFMGFTQELISLAERFEKEYGHIDFNAGEHDYWETIDEFSEKALLELYGPEPEQEYISAFHVIGEDGEELYYTIANKIGLVEAMGHMRFLVEAGALLEKTPFELLVGQKTIISSQEFDALVSERMDNTGRIAGVYEMDFHHHVFSAVHIMDGWHAWNFIDAARAVELAGKSKAPLRMLTEELQGKELTYFTHPASDIVKLSKLPLDEQISAVDAQNIKPTNKTHHTEPER